MIRVGHRLCVARSWMLRQLMERHGYVIQAKPQSHRDSVVPVEGGKDLIKPEIERHEDSPLTDVRCEAVEVRRSIDQRRTDDLPVHGSVSSHQGGGELDGRSSHRASVPTRLFHQRSIWADLPSTGPIPQPAGAPCESAVSPW